VSRNAAGCTAEHDIRLGEALHDGWTVRHEGPLGLTSAGGRQHRCPRHGRFLVRAARSLRHRASQKRCARNQTCFFALVAGYARGMAERHERIALNEAMFREGNERMSAWQEHQDAPPTKTLAFLCECADRDCRKYISMTLPEYEAVRADPMQFAIVPGHEVPEAEEVVERYEDYAVIKKDEDVRGIAEQTDPRGGRADV
jgi:hypothetical protein